MKVAKRKKQKRASADGYTGFMSPVENGSATVFEKDKFIEAIGNTNPQETFDMLNKALGVEGYGSCTTAEQIRIFKKYVPKLIGLYKSCHEALCASAKNEARLYDSTAERSGKRWQSDEDELLVELASRDEMSMTEMSVTMGRTPGAIQSRLSQLVGIGKVSQSVAGRFIGTIDGEHVHGYIQGDVSKC